MEMEKHAEEYETSLKRVQESLQAYPELEIKILPGSTHTAELAAQALGTTPGQIAKTLCFLADGKPILIVACGDKKIDTKKMGPCHRSEKNQNGRCGNCNANYRFCARRSMSVCLASAGFSLSG